MQACDYAALLKHLAQAGGSALKKKGVENKHIAKTRSITNSAKTRSDKNYILLRILTKMYPECTEN